MIKQEKVISDIRMGKEEIEISLFADGMMYLETPRESMINLT